MHLLIVEDHPVVAQALGAALTGTAHVRSFDHVTNVKDALALLRAHRNYALIVLDLQLHESNGLDALEVLRERYTHIPVIVFSADSSAESIMRVYEQGGRGYVNKSATMAEILGAIDIVMRGGNYVSAHAAALLGQDTRPTELADETIRRLSPRQEQILRRMLRGEPNKLVSRDLKIAVGTVKAHANAIYTMFGVHNRAELVARAAALGIHALLSQRKDEPS